MRPKPNSCGLLALLFLGLSASTALAQQSETFGRYEVHYSSIYTEQLSPQVASASDIQRSGSRAILNITVLDHGSGEPVAAEVRASASNLTGQRRDIEMRSIEDQGAIYAIGQFRVRNEETLNFRVEVRPEGQAGPPLILTFSQRYYTG